jgi:hypothetical protein
MAEIDFRFAAREKSDLGAPRREAYRKALSDSSSRARDQHRRSV